MKNHRFYIFLILILSCQLVSCERYLDEKPQKTQVTPSKLEDLQALLDRHAIMNEQSPILNDLASDDYYLTTDEYLARPDESDKLNHIWEKSATHSPSWVRPYTGAIYYSNTVLFEIDKLKHSTGQQELYNDIKGAALFFRAFYFERLAQLYCRPYSNSASTDLGIVLKLDSEVDVNSVRSTVQQTYDQIIKDLKEAASLLPSKTLYPTRPSKAAAYGELARTYLSMRDYVNAGIYADLCLKEFSGLIDYNTLLPVNDPPIHRFNLETIYYNHAEGTSTLANYRAIIDTNLYKSYNNNDLRKKVFFIEISDGKYGFQGGYDGDYSSYYCFDGITTGEQYLIRAESFARAGNKEAALADLNTLTVKRWKNDGSFIPFSATNAAEALRIVLLERRKELLFRGLRWSDLRRLNLEGANITLKRIIDGIEYTLPPNDLRWVMLIPNETTQYSNIKQNPR